MSLRFAIVSTCVLFFSACAGPQSVPVDDPAAYGPAMERFLTGTWTTTTQIEEAPWFLFDSSTDQAAAGPSSPGLKLATQPRPAVPPSAMSLTFLPPQGPPRYGEDWEVAREWGNYTAHGYLLVQCEIPGHPRVLKLLSYKLQELAEGEVRVQVSPAGLYRIRILGESGLRLTSLVGEESEFSLELRSRLPAHGAPEAATPPAGVRRADG